MRTTLDIDDELMAALEARHPGMSKTDLIETALRAYLALSSNYELRRLAGTLALTDMRAGR
jgi:Arc/MetJ family transcription regulator